MKVKVNAKLNLSLNVLDVKNGFHNIDSVTTSINVHDVVTVNARSDQQVTVCGLPCIADEQNTAYKAACGFVKQFDKFGADINIEKHIPFGAGMGGSSADAAAVVYCMCKLYGIDVHDERIKHLCGLLGSDINFMLRGGLSRLRGKGDDVQFYGMPCPLYFALTTFETSMSAFEVYAQFDKLSAKHVCVDNGALVKLLQAGKVQDAAKHLNNHLQSAVVSLSNYACEYLRFCDKHGIKFNMTGSGSAYYVACENERSARHITEMLNSNGFKTIVCHSVSRGMEIV